jgi:hypothetical protein
VLCLDSIFTTPSESNLQLKTLLSDTKRCERAGSVLGEAMLRYFPGTTLDLVYPSVPSAPTLGPRECPYRNPFGKKLLFI